MKTGDLVTNTRAVWDNPHVEGGPFPAGCTGVVVAVRPDTLNNPPLSSYVDVMLTHEGKEVWCGNYTQGHFEVLNDAAKVGDLVRVSHPNGAGAQDWWCPTGTLGVVTQVFGDRFHKGPGHEELEIVAATVGAAHAFYAEGWEVVS